MSKQIFNIGANTPVIDTSANTAARTYTMRDRNGTVADLVDVQAAEDAAKAYADTLVSAVARGSYDASGNVFPSTGGSGTAGAVKKNDTWVISVAGTLGGAAVDVGDELRALADAPGQTASNWVVTERNLGYVPENAANKDASGGYAGLTLFKLNIFNAAGTFKHLLSSLATATREAVFPDASGSLAFSSYDNWATIGNLTTGGSIGTAANTVDRGLPIRFTQTTLLSQNTGSYSPITFPPPTNTSSRIIIPAFNDGSVQVLVYGVTIPVNGSRFFGWNGTAWSAIGGGYTQSVQSGYHSAGDPSDSAAYHIVRPSGSLTGNNVWTAAFSFAALVPCTLTAANLTLIAGGVAGSGESFSAYVRVNDTTDYLIATVGSTSATRVFSNQAMNVPLAAGDLFQFKFIGAAWATNPTTVVGYADAIMS